ncbi:MAG TPA: hypothetical protein VF122_03930, partial [Caulobacteraceae bacterium]
MTATAPWSVKGIDPHAREVAKELARREGMTLGEWLNRMIVEQGGEAAPAPDFGSGAGEPIPLEPSVRGLLGRIEHSERDQVAVAARFEQLAEELRTDQMRLAERIRRMEQTADAGGGGGVTEALHSLEQTVGRLAGHVYDGESRTNDVIRDLGACFVKLDGRLRQVEGRGAFTGDASFAEALEGVRAEIAALSSDLERKLSRVDAINAHSLEKLGAEVARISERLAERITNAERRAALSAEEVGEQVSRVAERIHQRQERAADDVNERFRQAEERTARLLEGMRADIEANFAAAKGRPAPAPDPAPQALSPMETALSEPRVFAEPEGGLMSTRDVIDQARANVPAENPASTVRKDAPFALFPPRSKVGARRRSSSTTLQTALFVTGTAAALGAGVASYMLGVAEPAAPTITVKGTVDPKVTPAKPADGKAEPRVAVALGPQAVASTTPSVPAKAETTGPAAKYAEAVRLMQAKDPKGLAELKDAAEAGWPAAQFHLARLYESGDGVRKSETEARRWTEQAARGGDAKAMHNLALYYFEGAGGQKDTTLAAQWFRRAAEKGVTDSQFNLGRLYEE